ncbi:MAG: hypothetical protein Q4B85_07890 [Lachnospiraceae bacterium]|nr:hypothetical protein [Lachnospiraceae bacterium]
MRLKTLDQVDQFLKIVDSCKGNIYLTSKYGDRFNLRSKLSQFLAIHILLDEQGDDFELHCIDYEDHDRLNSYLRTHSS